MRRSPDASANRPVPPTIECLSAIETVGNTTMSPCPTTFTKIWSPLAAVQVAVPVAFPAVTVKSALRVNRPRWVAFPVPSRCLTVRVASADTTCSVASNVPLNGNAEPPLASVAPVPLTALDVRVGALGTSPPHAAARTHTPSSRYRISESSRSSRIAARWHSSSNLDLDSGERYPKGRRCICSQRHTAISRRRPQRWHRAQGADPDQHAPRRSRACNSDASKVTGAR